MNIPGFTASTSLYNTGGRYRASANRAGASATLGAVLPQMTRQQLDLPKESNPERARAIEDGAGRRLASTPIAGRTPSRASVPKYVTRIKSAEKATA